MTAADIAPFTDNASSPSGRTRIMNSMVGLLATKEFNRITTAEIARNAEVTEGLIYKYFSGKKDLLFRILAELFQQVITRIEKETAPCTSPRMKLRAFIRSSIASYAESRIFSKILLLEVRNSQRFFSSDAYSLVRLYAQMLTQILKEGVEAGEIVADIEIKPLRDAVLGAIEHACLPSIIFDKEIDVDTVSDRLCRIFLDGISLTNSEQRER